MSAPDPYGTPPGWPGGGTCYRHPDRSAGVTCRRCGRLICPDCMREAPVGWQCVECVHQASKRAPVVRWRPPGVSGAGRAGTLGNSRITPVVAALIAINVVVYLLESQHTERTIIRFGLQPETIHLQHQWYRLVTAAFLHENITHILFNMITLAIVGPPVESVLGRVRFTGLYLLAALGGSVASYLLSPANTYGVGASGAIFGVMGAYFVLARRRHWDISTIGILIVINLVLGFVEGGIDWRAHLGGLALGALAGWIYDATSDRRDSWRIGAPVGASAAILGALALLMLLPPGHVNL